MFEASTIITCVSYETRGKIGTLDSDPRTIHYYHTFQMEGVRFPASPGRRILGFCGVNNAVYKYFCLLGIQKDGSFLPFLKLGVLHNLLYNENVSRDLLIPGKANTQFVMFPFPASAIVETYVR